MHYARKNLPILLVAVLLTVLVFPTRASAWNAKGHWITAYVAYRNLTPVARARVDKLLRQHPDYDRWRRQVLPGSPTAAMILSPKTNLAIFIRASTWADDIKGDPRFYSDGKNPTSLRPGYVSMERHNDWHFVEMPFSTDGTQVTPGSTRLLEVLPTLRAELETGEEMVKVYSLPWVIHLVSDAHQPLHCVTRFTKAHGPPLGDLGGNGYRIRNGSQTTNLHSYWDSLPPETFTEKTVSSWLKQSRPPKLELSPQVWVDESVALAKEFVYTIGPDQGEPPPKVTAAYAAKAKLKARERLILAGYRLAGILNQTFKQ